MLSRFKDYIRQQHLFSPGEEVLLAVSGGRDSVCMAHLFHRAGIPFTIAHCNFHLRPGDCDRDEAFVRQLAESHGVPCHVAHFDTRAVAASTGESIEEAARRLRYQYFAQLLNQLDTSHLSPFTSHLSPSVVATAHHRDDSIETFFLNLFRGTGIAGLHGIRPISTQTIKHPATQSPSHPVTQPITIVRPLLCFSRADIDAYIAENHLDYVEDCTNAELDARRNQIRHRLMPLLRELYPSVDTTMAANMERLHDTELIYKQYIETLRTQLISPYSSPALPQLSPCSPPFNYGRRPCGAKGEYPAGGRGSYSSNQTIRQSNNHPPQILSLDLPALRNQFPLSNLQSSILFELLRPYAFNSATVADILSTTENGKLFYSPTHIAELHRGLLLIAELEPSVSFQYNGKQTIEGQKEGYIRPWQPGDRIKLKQSKLLSDYLKDLGLSRIERQHLLVRVNADGFVELIADDQPGHSVPDDK